MIQRPVRVIGAMVGLVALGAAAWSVTAGAAVAAGVTRLRSGSLHAPLASHVSPGTNAISSGLVLEGSDVIAAIVGTMAVLAVAFMVVTFIRRRVTVAA